MKQVTLFLLAVAMVALMTACTYPDPVIETTALPPGIVGIWYDFTIEVSNAGIVWSVEKGSLPPDLKLDPKKRRIYGYPLRVGTYPMRICNWPYEMSADEDCQEFTLTISAAPKSENK